MVNMLKENEAFELVKEEFERASASNARFNSAHEGYAVILEEIDELWDDVKLSTRKNPDRMKKCKEEAVQVAAMALRFLVDLCD